MATLVNTASSGITWGMVQGFCRDDSYFYGFDSNFGSSVNGLYKYDLDNSLSNSNLSPFSGMPDSATLRFSDGCIGAGIIYNPVHNSGSSARYLASYSAATLSRIDYVDILATGAGAAGCGFAPNGNLLFVNYSQTLNDPLAKEIIELTITGVYVTAHTLDTFIYGAQGITYDGDRDVYYISSDDNVAAEKRVYTINPSWEVTTTETPDDLTLEMEGLEYYSPYLYVSDIDRPPRIQELPPLATPPNAATSEYGFTYTLPTFTGSFTDQPIYLDDLAFPTGALDGANALMNNALNLRAYTDGTKATAIPTDSVRFTTGSDPEVRLYATLSSSMSGATIYIEADISSIAKELPDSPLGENSVWARSESSVLLSWPLFSPFSDRSGINDDINEIGLPTINNSGFVGGSGVSLRQSNCQNLVGETSWYHHFTGNTGVLVKTGAVSGHRMANSVGGGLALGLTQTHFGIFNNGWTYIPFVAGNDTDIDLWLTYDGSTYRLYNDGALVGTASYSQVVLASGTGLCDYGNNFGLTTGFHWTGLWVSYEFGVGVPSDEQISIEYNNKASPSTWGESSAWEDQGAGGTFKPFWALVNRNNNIIGGM